MSLKLNSKFIVKKSYGMHKAGDILIVGVRANNTILPNHCKYWVMNLNRGIKGKIFETELLNAADPA